MNDLMSALKTSGGAGRYERLRNRDKSHQTATKDPRDKTMIARFSERFLQSFVFSDSPALDLMLNFMAMPHVD
ncbi:MAG: hypothetical protein LUO85_04310 [Methanomassiliicoccales archaeon]|nr:hypothetical protein [Methanomassiliicoccales archaeon]